MKQQPYPKTIASPRLRVLCHEIIIVIIAPYQAIPGHRSVLCILVPESARGCWPMPSQLWRNGATTDLNWSRLYTHILRSRLYNLHWSPHAEDSVTTLTRGKEHPFTKLSDHLLGRPPQALGAAASGEFSSPSPYRNPLSEGTRNLIKENVAETIT